jgi:hypothetical protein
VGLGATVVVVVVEVEVVGFKVELEVEDHNYARGGWNVIVPGSTRRAIA